MAYDPENPSILAEPSDATNPQGLRPARFPLGSFVEVGGQIPDQPAALPPEISNQQDELLDYITNFWRLPD